MLKIGMRKSILLDDAITYQLLLPKQETDFKYAGVKGTRATEFQSNDQSSFHSTHSQHYLHSSYSKETCRAKEDSAVILNVKYLGKV